MELIIQKLEIWKSVLELDFWMRCSQKSESGSFQANSEVPVNVLSEVSTERTREAKELQALVA